MEIEIGEICAKEGKMTRQEGPQNWSSERQEGGEEEEEELRRKLLKKATHRKKLEDRYELMAALSGSPMLLLGVTVTVMNGNSLLESHSTHHITQ